MTRKQLVSLSLISAAAAVGIGGATAALKTDLPGESRSPLLKFAASTDGHGCHRFNGGVDGDIEQRTERLIAFVEEEFQSKSSQRAAWQDLVKRLRTAATTFAEVGHDADAGGMGARERMAQAENMMATGLAALQSVRPAFDALYGTLSPAQRKTFDAFAARHHHSGVL